MMPATSFIAIAIFAAAPADAPVPTVSPGKVLWRGTPSPLRRSPGAPTFDLSPDGSAFVFVQGDPWPRVVLQRIPADGADTPPGTVLGDAEPFGDRPPRFDSDGRSIFFTEDLAPPQADAARPFTRSPRSPRRETSREPHRLTVVRARTEGGKLERILPGPGSDSEESAVFLDIHPGGRTILVGTGKNILPHQVTSGDFTLQLVEVDFRGDGTPIAPPRPLSLGVSGGAPIRYSWDGTAILYGVGPVHGRQTVKVLRFVRSSGVQEETGLDTDSMGRLAGDLEVHDVLLYHPGVFGWDGFRLSLLGRTAGGLTVPLRITEQFQEPLPLAPMAFRGDRALFAGGFEDRKVVAVAAWDPADVDRRLAAGSGIPLRPDLPALIPGFSSDEVRAKAADPGTEVILRRMLSSRNSGKAAPVRSAKARWSQTPSPGGPVGEIRVEATESADGPISIRRSRPSGKPGDPPLDDLLVWDGKQGWTIDERGSTFAASRETVLSGSTMYSPLRLLIDPAGLGLSWMEFRLAGEATEPGPDGRERRIARLEARSIDGFRASVFVELKGELALPVRIETPIIFPEERTRRELALTKEARTLTFEDYRTAADRMVPGKVRFDDGMAASEMTLLQLELNPPPAAEEKPR
jgi:hypothetical protein